MVRGLFRRSKPRQAALLPQGVRIYAVGDVHGRVDLLDELLGRIERHRRIHPIARPVQVFVGDYIDRGPASAEVLDRLATGTPVPFTSRSPDLPTVRSNVTWGRVVEWLS